MLTSAQRDSAMLSKTELRIHIVGQQIINQPDFKYNDINKVTLYGVPTSTPRNKGLIYVLVVEQYAATLHRECMILNM